MSGENTEKYKNFSALIEKKVTKMVMKHGIHGNESVVTKSYDIKFIDSTRFMAISLLNLVNNLTEKIHKSKCKDCYCFLEYESIKDN